MADIMGGNYETVTSNTTVSDGPYYAITADADGATISTTVYGQSGGEALSSFSLAGGQSIVFREGWKKVTKNSGGDIICYKG